MTIDPQKLEAIFEAARVRTAGEREAYVEAACEGDAELRASVDALLVAHDEAGAFLEPPKPTLAMPFMPPGIAISLRTRSTLPQRCK